MEDVKTQEALEKEAQVTLDEVTAKEKFYPVTQTGRILIDKMMKEYYPPEVAERLTISEDRIPGLLLALKTINKNLLRYAGPLTCKGPTCYAKEKCPMQAARIAPVGAPCPIEMMLIDAWEEEYLEDLDVDRQSKNELDMVREMVEADLIDWRTSQEVAENGLFDWQNIAMMPDGTPIKRKEESVALGIKLKFKARKDRLREDLMATRKMKVKFGLNRNIDPSKMAADLNSRFRKIKDAEIVKDEMPPPPKMELEKDA